MNKDFYYEEKNPDFPEKIPESFKTGLAIASFVISMINLLFCVLSCSFILSPVSIILGIVSLAKKQGGRPLAITGIVISTISILIFGWFTSIFVKFYPDMEYFMKNDTAIIAEFEESGEIPEQFEKYRSPEYDKYWATMQCDNFDEFFEIFIEVYRQSHNTYTLPSNPDNSDIPANPAFPPDDGEDLVELGYTGAISGTKFLITA